jgi:F420H(2)-dependent quinone reductase
VQLWPHWVYRAGHTARDVAEGLVRAGAEHTIDATDRTGHDARFTLSAMHGAAAAPWPRRGSPVSRRVGTRASVVSARMSIYESVFRTTLQVHAFIYEHTEGLIGHRILGLPCLMLRTTGRKTAQTRTNSLVCAKDADRYPVVASKGGDPNAPAWLLNLRAKPQVQVQIGRTRFPATATEIGPDDPDYARLWKLVNDNNGNRYDTYQKKTTRPIPVVALSRTT